MNRREEHGSPEMLAHQVIESPIGSLLLTAVDGVLAGIEMPVTKGKPR